jgi:hypothetical protein
VIPSEATRLLENAVAGRSPYHSAVWRMIALGAWIHLFNVSP